MNTVSKGLFEKISRQKADIQFVDYLYEAGDVFYFGINNHVYGYSPDMEKSVFESYVRSIKDPVILMGFLVENAVLVDFERAEFCPLMESLYIGKKTSLSESEDVEDAEGETEEDSESEESEEDDDFFSDEDEEESEYSRAYGAAYTDGFEDAVSGKENRYEAEIEDEENPDEESLDSEDTEGEESDEDETKDIEEGFVGSDQSAGGLGYGGLGEEQYPGEDLAVEPVYKESEESDEDAEDIDPDFTDETPDDNAELGDDEMSETEMGERDGYEDGYADGLIFSQEMSDEGDEEETEEEELPADEDEKALESVRESFEDDEEDDDFEEEPLGSSFDEDDEALLNLLSEEEAIELFCAFVECDPYEIEASWEDERGDWHFVIDNQEYLVDQDREVRPQNGE